MDVKKFATKFASLFLIFSLFGIVHSEMALSKTRDTETVFYQ